MVRVPKRTTVRNAPSGGRKKSAPKGKIPRSRPKRVTLRTDPLSWSEASEKLKKAGGLAKKGGKIVGKATLGAAKAGVRGGEAYFDWVYETNQRIDARNLRDLDARVKRARMQKQLLLEEATLEEELAQLRHQKALARRRAQRIHEMEEDDSPRPRRAKSSGPRRRAAM